MDKLDIINGVSNTFKHSFINSETHNLYGADAPTVNILDPKGSIKGTKPTEPVLRSYFLHGIIHWYSTFFFYARDAEKEVQKQLWQRMKNLQK